MADVGNQLENTEQPFVGLSVGYLWSDDHSFEVRLTASNGECSGVADIYESEHIYNKVAALLAGFPTSGDEVRSIQIGGGPKFAGGYATLPFRALPTGVARLYVTLTSEPGEQLR